MGWDVRLGWTAVGGALLALAACSSNDPREQQVAAKLAGNSDIEIPAQARQLPQYTPAGELILPKNFETWIFVGSPLTPDALNGGKANFPEYHNVYIEPVSYRIYQRTGTFPEGTIMFKELQRTLENFNHSEPKAAVGKLRSKEECASCHLASAKKDSVWTQFYPRLDK